MIILFIIIILFLIGFIIGNKAPIEDLTNECVDECNEIDELNDPVSIIEAEIMAQEEIVDVYYKYWLHEDEKFRSIPEYKKETDDYYKKWKSAQEAKAKYLKADARLAKLKEKSGVDYVINL